MRQLDEYEREFMSDGTPVLYRERLSYPTWYRYLVMIIVLLTLIGAGVMAVMLREWLLALPVAMTPIWALLLLMMATLRISVTNKAVHIQYGVFGPTIPLDKIELCAPDTFSFLARSDNSIYYSVTEGAWCYNMLGNKGQALRIHYRTDSGKLKKVLIASADSTALANAINKARSGGVADGVIFSETMGTEVEEVELVQEVEAVASVHA